MSSVSGFRFRVYGLAFLFPGLGFRVYGLGFRVWLRVADGRSTFMAQQVQ